MRKERDIYFIRTGFCIQVTMHHIEEILMSKVIVYYNVNDVNNAKQYCGLIYKVLFTSLSHISHL